MTAVELRDVCARDGLQDHDAVLATDIKVELIRRLYDAGIRSIEATSFVSPKRVPQLADAADLCAALAQEPLDQARLSVFVATRGGMRRAMAHPRVDELSTTVPVTDEMARANFGRTSDEMLEEVAAMRAEAGDALMSVTIAVAFGCPYAGRVAPEGVLRLADRLAQAGYDRILLGDTIGVANPRDVTSLYQALAQRLSTVTLGAHFHDARGSAAANVVAAVQSGASLVDAALSGMGGCPFAPGAAGNVSTEDAAWLLSSMGYELGVDLDALAEASRWWAGHIRTEMRSRMPSARRFDWELV